MRDTYPLFVPAWPRLLVAPTAIFVLVFTMGVGSFAYASPSVTDSHPLYVVKTGIESVEGMMHRSPGAKAQYHARMMERRLAEGEREHSLKQLSERHIDEIAHQFSNVITHVSTASADTTERDQIVTQLQSQVARYDYLMQLVEAESEVDTRAEMHLWVSESELSDDQKRALYEHLKHTAAEAAVDVGDVDQFISPELRGDRGDVPRVRFQ